MSSYANGCMTVVLPEEHIGEFERFFDQDYEYSFLNTEITLKETESVDKVGYQKRIYDISCNTSLEACLIENEENDIGDVYLDLGLALLDIDARNDGEDFNESIKFDEKDKICRYDSDSWLEGRTSRNLKVKSEAEAE